MKEYQLHMTRGQPDEEAVRLLQVYELMALSYDPRGYCVCSSEGKDSRVLGHLMRRAGVKHFYMHNVTGIDPPELTYFQRKSFQAYADMGYLTYDCKYTMSMWTLMQKRLIPPLRQKRFCCEHLKERKTAEQAGAMIATGVRRAESVRRRMNRSELEINYKPLIPYENETERGLTEACNQKDLVVINPIAEWSDSDIWSYSREAGLEQCCLYREGFHRLGCIGCPMAGEMGRRREFARWPKFRDIWIRTLGKMLEIRRERGLKILNHASTAEDWFEWWISDRSQETPPDEQQLFFEGYYDRP